MTSGCTHISLEIPLQKTVHMVVYGFLFLVIRFCCQTLPEGIHAQIHLCT